MSIIGNIKPGMGNVGKTLSPVNQNPVQAQAQAIKDSLVNKLEALKGGSKPAVGQPIDNGGAPGRPTTGVDNGGAPGRPTTGVDNGGAPGRPAAGRGGSGELA